MADVHLRAVEIERVAFQAEYLAAPPSAAGGQVDDRPVPLGQGTGERVDLVWPGDVVLRVRDLREPDTGARRHPDAPVHHRGMFAS
jgi:hypothetical protein